MTGYQRAKLLNFCDVLVFDAKRSGVSTFDWAKLIAVVFDQEKKIRETCTALSVTESGEMYGHLCEFLLEECPKVKIHNKVNISDGLFLSEGMVPIFFPESQHMDDAFHMVNINCVQNCPVQELMKMKPLVWKMVKVYDECEFDEAHSLLMRDCPVFYNEYFASNWMTRKHRWACHLTQKVFTGGVIASSYAESSGAAQGRWFQSARSSLVEILLSCLEKEDLDIKKEQRDLALIAIKAQSGVPSDPPFVRSCRSIYSEHVTELVLREVVDSANYTAFVRDCANFGTVDDGCSLVITVKRNVLTEKERTVTVFMQPKDSPHIQGCTCPKVTNCGHPCRHIFSACVLLAAQFSVQICLSHLLGTIQMKMFIRAKKEQALNTPRTKVIQPAHINHMLARNSPNLLQARKVALLVFLTLDLLL